MKRLLPALLLALLLTGCSAMPAAGDAAPDQDTAGSPGQDQAAASDETPLHTCIWEGDDGTREDIIIFGPSDDEPFTRVELVELIPTKVEIEDEDPEAVRQYFDDVKDAIASSNGIDPDILTVDSEGGKVRLTYECRSLKDLQSVHGYYSDETAGGVFETASGMTGTTTCDGKPVEKGDLKDFDADMKTVRDWAEANRETGHAYLDGTLDAAAEKKYTDETSTISDLVLKWSRSKDLLNDGQEQTLQEVKKELADTLLTVS